jgi:hypothetical protein
MSDAVSQTRQIQGWIDRLRTGDESARKELFNCAYNRLTRDRLPHPAGAVVYCYRHTSATDARANGVPTVAELVDPKDLKMIQDHSCHWRRSRSVRGDDPGEKRLTVQHDLLAGELVRYPPAAQPFDVPAGPDGRLADGDRVRGIPRRQDQRRHRNLYFPHDTHAP